MIKYFFFNYKQKIIISIDNSYNIINYDGDLMQLTEYKLKIFVHSKVLNIPPLSV